MKFICQPSNLRGEVMIPGSKSHTIRGLVIGTLAEGNSVLEKPLHAADPESARNAVIALGAEVEPGPGPEEWTVHGIGPHPRLCNNTVDVGNSGTTLNLLMSVAALLPEQQSLRFTGDAQIQRRPSGPLLHALRELGCRAESERGNDCAPLIIGGRLQGGRTRLEARTSQYLSSLLLACPLADHDTEIEVPLLYEAAYVRMTLDWLKQQNTHIQYTSDMKKFHIPGRQRYQPFRRRIPGDFSSATFFLAAGALPGNHISSEGLDINDSQGDKAVVEHLRSFGAEVRVMDTGIEVAADKLRGREIDLNDTPDALPALAVLGCFAEGETKLVNVPQARIKETDRISVMATELAKMGADIEELEDGLRIRESCLHGTVVDGHDDHRVIMALALAGLASSGTTTIQGSESAAVTFPEYHRLIQKLGGKLESI